MKKHLILLLIAGLFSLTSCSSDDDGGTETENSVVGTWVLVAMNPDVIGLECPDDSIFTFSDDGTANWTIYSDQNNCVAQADSGIWEQNTASEYTMTLPQIGSVTGTVVFESSTRFVFSSSYQGIPFTLTFEK